VCDNCERIGVSCPGYISGPLNRSERAQLRNRNSRGITEAGIKRTRLFESCKVCRHAKTKCSGDSPACLRCTEKNLPCVYEAGRRRERNRNAMSDCPPQQTKATPQSKHDASLTSPHLVEELPLHDRQRNHRNHSIDVAPIRVSSEPVPPQEKSLDWYEYRLYIPQCYSNAWYRLTSPLLPNQERVCQLVEAYFANVHPLRCFGFIHKPSFMEKLDLGLAVEHQSNALLYIVCALGAK
jgi:hypothetical protein